MGWMSTDAGWNKRSRSSGIFSSVVPELVLLVPAYFLGEKNCEWHKNR